MEGLLCKQKKGRVLKEAWTEEQQHKKIQLELQSRLEIRKISGHARSVTTT